MKITHVVKAAIPVALCLLVLPALVCADSIIYFVDGTSTQGDIRKSGISNYLITRENGKWEIVPASDIKAIRNGNEISYLGNTSTPVNVNAIQTQTPAAQAQEASREKMVNQGQFEDKIYLDDGQVLSGKIVSQNSDTVMIVSESGQSDEINTKYIRRISKVDNKPIVNTGVPARTESIYETYNSHNSYYKHINKKKTGEFVIKAGPNVSGRHKIKDASIYVSGYGTYELSGADDVDTGVSLSAEYVKYVEKNFGLGVGVTYQFPRKISDTEAKFSFTPIYALAKIHTLPDSSGRYFYGIGQLGYNTFAGNDEYEYILGNLKGGLYTGIGCGFSDNSMIFELLYSTNQGSFEDSYYDYYYYAEQKGKIIYSCLSMNIGVKF